MVYSILYPVHVRFQSTIITNLPHNPPPLYRPLIALYRSLLLSPLSSLI